MRTAACALLLALASCGSSSDPAPTSLRVGAAGAVVISPDGARLDIPAGALAADTVIELGPTAGVAAPPFTTAVGAGYRPAPDSQRFALPVAFTLPVGGFPGGRSAADVTVYRRSAGGIYTALVTQVVDQAHVAVMLTELGAMVPAVFTCGPASHLVGACDLRGSTCGQTCTEYRGTQHEVSCTCAGAERFVTGASCDGAGALGWCEFQNQDTTCKLRQSYAAMPDQAACSGAGGIWHAP